MSSNSTTTFQHPPSPFPPPSEMPSAVPSTKRSTCDLKMPTKKDGSIDMRYAMPQFVKSDGTRDMRTVRTTARK